MHKLLGVVKAQHVEQGVETPRYLISTTGDGSCTLRLKPAAPPPLQVLIFLNEGDDIRAWLLVNDGRHPLDLMILESRTDWREDSTPMPEPADGRYRYFDRMIWDRFRQEGDNLGIQEEEDDDYGDDYDQDGGGRRSREKSNSNDKDDKDDKDDELAMVSWMAEKESAARIDHVSLSFKLI